MLRLLNNLLAWHCQIVLTGHRAKTQVLPGTPVHCQSLVQVQLVPGAEP